MKILLALLLLTSSAFAETSEECKKRASANPGLIQTINCDWPSPSQTPGASIQFYGAERATKPNDITIHNSGSKTILTFKPDGTICFSPEAQSEEMKKALEYIRKGGR